MAKVKSQQQAGLVFAATPASDFICGTQQLASMNMHVFTTGEGSPYGLALVPVIKVSSRTALAEKWHDLIDIDAGLMATGDATVEEVGMDLFQIHPRRCQRAQENVGRALGPRERARAVQSRPRHITFAPHTAIQYEVRGSNPRRAENYPRPLYDPRDDFHRLDVELREPRHAFHGRNFSLKAIGAQRPATWLAVFSVRLDLRHRADSGRLAAGSFRFEKRIRHQHPHMVDIHIFPGLRRSVSCDGRTDSFSRTSITSRTRRGTSLPR